MYLVSYFSFLNITRNLPVYKNVFVCPPITKSMSSTCSAICTSVSKPEWPRAMSTFTPSFFNRFASALIDGISGNIFTLPRIDVSCVHENSCTF